MECKRKGHTQGACPRPPSAAAQTGTSSSYSAVAASRMTTKRQFSAVPVSKKAGDDSTGSLLDSPVPQQHSDSILTTNSAPSNGSGAGAAVARSGSERSSSSSVIEDGGNASGGAPVYKNDIPSHQRVFRWGVGNRFRAINANRFSPVHEERAREMTVRNDYFEAPNEHIKWEPLNEAWEVFWYEHHKLNAKPFPVKKFGIEQSKREALAFYEQLGVDKRQEAAPSYGNKHSNVKWDERLQSWVGLYFDKKGRPQSLAFSAKKHGFEHSKQLAQDVQVGRKIGFTAK